MKLEGKALELFNEWLSWDIKNAEERLLMTIDGAFAQSPKMTPIEELVFMRLMQYADSEGWRVIPQCPIGKYTVDFLIDNYYSMKMKRTIPLVIECDGHDFHERTKEQAQHDKKRDRNIQSDGFLVFRFTGSEIWKSNGMCVIYSIGTPI